MPTKTAHSAVPLEPVKVAVSPTVRVRWVVARDAVASRLGQPVSSDDVFLELLARLSPDGWLCVAHLIDGAKTIALETSPVEATVGGWVSDRETGLDHLDLPGFLHATFRGGVVLYARTPLLAGLGVPGGRYEVDVPAEARQARR